MKILGLSCGTRNGNNDTMCRVALEAAKEMGAEIEFIHVFDWDIKYCTGCVACSRSLVMGKGMVCSQKDDFAKLFDKMAEADGVLDIHFVAEFREEDLRIFVHPLVPMAIHEILVDAARGFVKAGVEFVEVAGARHGFGGDEDHGFAVGGKFKAFNAALEGAEHFLGTVLYRHGNHFVAAAEEQGVVILPYGVEFAGGGSGEADGLAAFGGHQVKFGVALVLFHTIVGEGVGQLFPVRGDGCFAHLA